MRYRNEITGAEIETNSEIIAPNWIKLGAVAPVETVKEVPEETTVKKSVPKKTTKRTKK